MARRNTNPSHFKYGLVALFFVSFLGGCGGMKSSSAVVEELIDAISVRNKDKAKELISEFPEVMGSSAAQEECLLSCAIEDMPEVVPLLIEAGLSVADAKSVLGSPILHDAVLYADAELVSLLIEHGADPNLMDESRRSPLAEVCYRIANMEDKDVPRLEGIKEVLIAKGAILHSAESLKRCPNGTLLSEVDVVEHYVELSEKDRERVRQGSLVKVEGGAFLGKHPFSVTSRWHFNPFDQRWDRVADSVDSFQRPFPDVINKFVIPGELQVKETEYRQVLEDGKLVVCELNLFAAKMAGTDFKSLILKSLRAQGIEINESLDGVESVCVELENGWELDVSVFEPADEGTCALWLVVKRR